MSALGLRDSANYDSNRAHVACHRLPNLRRPRLPVWSAIAPRSRATTQLSMLQQINNAHDVTIFEALNKSCRNLCGAYASFNCGCWKYSHCKVFEYTYRKLTSYPEYSHSIDVTDTKRKLSLRLTRAMKPGSSRRWQIHLFLSAASSLFKREKLRIPD